MSVVGPNETFTFVDSSSSEVASWAAAFEEAIYAFIEHKNKAAKKTCLSDQDRRYDEFTFPNNGGHYKGSWVKGLRHGRVNLHFPSFLNLFECLLLFCRGHLSVEMKLTKAIGTKISYTGKESRSLQLGTLIMDILITDFLKAMALSLSLMAFTRENSMPECDMAKAYSSGPMATCT